MTDVPRQPPPEGERIVRREIIEETAVSGVAPARRTTSMWAWILPLVIVVIGLVWFVFTNA